MKTWVGNTFIAKHPLGTCHSQVRVIVRSRSRAAALRALNAHGLKLTDAYLRNYWSETGNPDELSVTDGTVDQPFVTSGLLGGPFRYERLKPKGTA